MNKILHMGGVSVLTCLQFFDSLFKATEELISDKKALPTSDYFRMDEGRSLHKNNNFWFLKLTACFYESYCTTRKKQAELLPIAKKIKHKCCHSLAAVIHVSFKSVLLYFDKAIAATDC